MVTWVVVGFLVMAVVGGVLMTRNNTDIAMFLGLICGLIIGGLVTLWISINVSYIPDTKIQPMVSIFLNQSENEIYLKAISGSQLIYWIDEDGVPREQTVSTGNVKDVKIEAVSPYLEITTYLFKEEWYKYFAISTMNDEYVFHVPQSGLEADINDLLK